MIRANDWGKGKSRQITLTLEEWDQSLDQDPKSLQQILVFALDQTKICAPYAAGIMRSFCNSRSSLLKANICFKVFIMY